MVWVVGIGIFLLLLFMFPRFTLGLIAIIGVTIFILFERANTNNRQAAERRALVGVTAGYDASRCSIDYPILVSIMNRSPQTVVSTSFTLKGYASGHSDAIYDSGYGSYRDDRIIEPGGGWSICWSVPRRSYNVSEERAAAYPPSSMIWRVDDVSPAFQR